MKKVCRRQRRGRAVCLHFGSRAELLVATGRYAEDERHAGWTSGHCVSRTIAMLKRAPLRRDRRSG